MKSLRPNFVQEVTRNEGQAVEQGEVGGRAEGREAGWVRYLGPGVVTRESTVNCVGRTGGAGQ